MFKWLFTNKDRFKITYAGEDMDLSYEEFLEFLEHCDENQSWMQIENLEVQRSK